MRGSRCCGAVGRRWSAERDGCKGCVRLARDSDDSLSVATRTPTPPTPEPLVDEGPGDTGVESADVTPDHGALRALIGDVERESVELVVYYPAVKFEQIDLRRALICLEMDGGIEFERSVGVVKMADVDRTAQYLRELEDLGIAPHPCVEEKVMMRLVNEMAGAYVRRPACVVLFHGGGGVVHEIFNLVANGVRVILVALPEHVHQACHNRDGLTILDPRIQGWCYPPRSDDEWRERGEAHA